jgi:hypothetical protein
MAKIPPIIPISDLRQDAALVLKNLNKSKKPLVITQTCASRSGATHLCESSVNGSHARSRWLLFLALPGVPCCKSVAADPLAAPSDVLPSYRR